MQKLNSASLSSKELWLFVVVCFLFLCLNLGFYYQKYKDFKSDEIFFANAYVAAIYDDNKTVKFETDSFHFYSKADQKNLAYLDEVTIEIETKNVDFVDYLHGFWAKSFMVEKQNQKSNSLLFELTEKIDKMHEDKNIASFFNALFFGTNLNKFVNTQSINFGILHLIALSGYHLSVIAAVVYFVVGFFYKFIHNKFFPFRNFKYDLLMISLVFVTFYVFLAGFIPSLVRSFAMYVFGVYLLRNNVKILSYNTLAIICIFLIAIFPKLLFAVGFWFSICGIFYIYLYLQYFSKLNKIVSFVFFNVWIFFAMNPIVHYFFDMTSLWQLSSPIFTMFFVVFFPLEIFLHIINFGDLFDFAINFVLQIETFQYPKSTNFEFFVLTIALSVGSIFSKKVFYFLNLFIVIYTIWLFSFF